MPPENKNINGAVKTPATESPAARITVPAGPVTGQTGEAVLTEALAHALLEPGTREEEPKGNADESAPIIGTGGEVAVKPEKKILSSDNAETPEQKTEREAREAREEMELSARAEANGVTVEEQAAAEATELSRLEAKAAELNLTVEEVAAQEETDAAKAGKTFTQEQVEQLVQKRLKNATAQIADLQAQVNAKVNAAPQDNDPLGMVFDAGKLGQFQEQAAAGLEYTDGLLGKLAYAGARVEKDLRALAKANPQIAEQFRDEAGEEDFSAEKIADVLETAKRDFKETLKAVPKRAAYLKTFSAVEAVVKKVAPYLFDVEDEHYGNAQKIVAAKPWLKSSPTWQYDVAAWMEGHKVLQEKLKAAGAGAKPTTAEKVKFVPKVKFPKTGGRGGGLPPVTGDRRQAALAKIKANPKDEAALESYFSERMGG